MSVGSPRRRPRGSRIEGDSLGWDILTSGDVGARWRSPLVCSSSCRSASSQSGLRRTRWAADPTTGSSSPSSHTTGRARPALGLRGRRVPLRLRHRRAQGRGPRLLRGEAARARLGGPPGGRVRPRHKGRQRLSRPVRRLRGSRRSPGNLDHRRVAVTLLPYGQPPHPRRGSIAASSDRSCPAGTS